MLSKIRFVPPSSVCLTISMIAMLAMLACAPHPSPQAPPVPGECTQNQAAREGLGSDEPPDDGYVNPQGTELQAVPPGFEGFYVDATRGWSHRGVAMAGAAVICGELVIARPRRLAGADLVGASFDATLVSGDTVPMHITRVVHHRNPWDGPKPRREQTGYLIEYLSAGRWMPLCDSEAAIPVTGSFGRAPHEPPNGDHDPTPTRLTFACESGVAAKCQGWGYPSWDPRQERYFQACTRMARADYCATGRSHTVDHTPINYIDLHGQPPGPLKLRPGFMPEAVWGRGGSRAPSAAICLSRTRWSTIPLGPRSPCADILLDPRDETATDRTSRKFCDDLTVADWANEGALFAQNSLPFDVGVVVWRDDGGHYATTTQFPWLGKDAGSQGPPGYPVFVSIEGAAFKPEVREPRKHGMVPLVRYIKKERGITLELLTTGPPVDGFHTPVLEAYVLEYKPSSEPPTSTARPLILHTDGQGHYVTTSEERGPAGYSLVRQIGWLPH